MTPIKIGLMLSEQGPAGIWSPSAHACAKLAVNEINAESGLLGLPMELVTIDAGANGHIAATAAQRAIKEQHIAGLVGMFPSYARRPVTQAIGGAIPFVYTPQFEGLETDSRLVTTGETADELLLPAIEWLMREKKATRFFLCGSDYIWPRATFACAKRILARVGGVLMGEGYLPLESDAFEPFITNTIKHSRSDAVLTCFLGLDEVAFHRAFASAGLAANMLRLSTAVDETVLYNIAETSTENLFLSSAYFSSMRTHNNGAFLERYHTAYGDNPPPANAFGQSCYEGIYSLAALVETAGSLRAADVYRAIGRACQTRSARGQAPIVGQSHPVHLARVDGLEVKILNTARY